MTRFRFLPSKICFSRTVALTVLLSGALFSTRMASADEFSLLPTGDPVYGQLSTLSRPGDSKSSSLLTRYEAALQAARAMMDVQNRDQKLVTRSQWRALKALSVSLKTELRQLGVDVDSIQIAADRNLKTPEFKASDLPAPAPLPKSLPTRLAKVTPASQPKTVSPRGGLLLASPGLDTPGVKSTLTSIPLSQQLRLSAALMATERVGNDPFDTSFGRPLRSFSAGSDNRLASETSLGYDVNPWFTVRAGSSDRRLNSGQGTSPLLSAPFFAGATQAKGTGGGVDINVGRVKFSTEVERLRANTGLAASRIGGGASLSTNRLSMSINMSRLQPEDAAALPAFATQVGVDVGVTQRLKLSLLYQSLYAQTTNTTGNSESRVSGGLSLSF